MSALGDGEKCLEIAEVWKKWKAFDGASLDSALKRRLQFRVPDLAEGSAKADRGRRRNGQSL